MSKVQPNIEVVEVTPDLAHEWLGLNTHNRNKKPRAIAAYAADMKAGKWRWNGESIKFAADGTLLDGQNRLYAVIEADVTVRMLVIRGLPSEAQETMDGGAKRKFSDVLTLRGEPNATTLAAMTRRINWWEAGYRRAGGNYAPTVSQMMETLDSNPWLREAAVMANRTAANCGLPASIIGLCIWLFTQIDADDAEGFITGLGNDQHGVKGNPVYELRRAAQASKSVRGQRSETYLTAITIKAWNAYRAGDTIGNLRFRPGGANPEQFPEPK